jgi:sporulation protein YlmC with PRC-barrel domain
MLIDWRKLNGLPVYTVSGRKLGKISSVIFDIDFNTVFQYEVRTRSIGGRTFLINPSQIVEWGGNKIVVEDGLSKDFAPVNLVESANS